MKKEEEILEKERKETEKLFKKLSNEEFTIWTEDWFFNQPRRFREELEKIIKE